LDKLRFSVEKFEIGEDPNSHFTKLKLYIVSEGNNLHNFPISWETIEKAKESLVGKPILCKYNKYTKSFEGHEDDEIPVGFFISFDDISEETIENKRWLVSVAYLWKKYFPEVIDVFRNHDGKSDISMEIEVSQMKEHDDGLKWIEAFCFAGVTLIGVSPAIENAHGEVLQFSQIVEAAQMEQKLVGFNQPDDSNQKEVKDVMKDFKTEIEKKFSLTSSQITEILSNALSEYKYQYSDDYVCEKYYVESFDDVYAYLYDREDGKVYRATYVIVDNAATVDVGGKQEVIRGGYEVVGGQGEGAGESNFAEGEKPKGEGEGEGGEGSPTPVSMSLDDYLDVVAALAYLEAETEDSDEMVDRKEFADELKKEEKDFCKMSAKAFSMYQKMCAKYAQALDACNKMSAEKETFSKENDELKVFKSDIEKQQKAFQVEAVLNEIKEFVPTEFADECRVDAENYPFAEISVWENFWKSKALPHVVKGAKKNDDGIVRMQMPWTTNVRKNDSLWK
jgi:hypothetical protein